MKHLFNYRWEISDGYPAQGIKPNGKKVFGTFICGGGSSMGYKLAGYEHLGGVELDKDVADTYEINHHPKYLFNEDIRDFNKRHDLPEELYNLDLLDGSPPCSAFSTAGDREKAWGKEKVFAEGQKLQTLDDLVFVYCETILKLKPKCFVLENVSGLIKGNAKSYAKKIIEYLTLNGYVVQLFLLNSASMGVPQKRERVFFIGHKKEYKLPKLVLNFNEEPILASEITDYEGSEINGKTRLNLWENRKKGDRALNGACKRLRGRDSFFNYCFVYQDKVSPTLPATEILVHFNKPLFTSTKEKELISSFPLDYKFGKRSPCFYMGMSVPPVMTAQISHQIYLQWLSKI